MNNGNYDHYLSDKEVKQSLRFIQLVQILIMCLLGILIVSAAITHAKDRVEIELKQLEERSKY